MPLIADRVSHTYAPGTAIATDAVRSVSLTVEPGSLTVVLGATGSGKSTLLRILAGLLEPTEGRALVDGVPCSSREARGKVGLVLQNPEAHLFADTVLADVAFGPRNLGIADPTGAARRALALVGLDPDRFGGRSPFTLSGGEARRAAIAGIIAFEPAYLLLDEPTAGLDGGARRAVLAVLERLRSERGIVVVTHDVEHVLDIADTVVVLHDGAIIHRGTPPDLVEDPAAANHGTVRIPDVVQVQLLARRAGLPLQRIVFDPRAAARGILEAREATV